MGQAAVGRPVQSDAQPFCAQGDVQVPGRPNVTKRAFDIVFSSLALLVLASPLLIVMTILRLTGEGEVWFFQERVGLNGRRFKVFKFATMRKDSEVTGTKDITMRNDPRVLPVGQLLRKGKINELPQIIN